MDITLIITQFENEILTGYTVETSGNLKKLLKIKENIIYALGKNLYGKYLQNFEMVEKLRLAWTYLLLQVINKHQIEIPKPANFAALKHLAIRSYRQCLDRYQDCQIAADECYATINWNNSSQRQIAVSKYEKYLKIAEQLFEADKIEVIKARIHELYVE